MGTQYTLRFVNNSQNMATACVYQTDPEIGVPNVMSLAWFAKGAAPTTHIAFSWQIDYSFVWSEIGTLAPGVMFDASQVWDADLTSMNQVSFTCQGGIYTFANQQIGPSPGSLTILEDSTLPANQAAVGIGVSRKPAYVVQAQPNWNLTFIPHPEYWITFGNFLEGEVLDVQSISNKAEVRFPPNVYSMTAILNPDNTWSVKPTREMNARFLAARNQGQTGQWGQLAAP